MALQIPLFSLRHGTAAGLESCIANLVVGIIGTGTPLTLPIASVDRLNPEFAHWVRQQSLAEFAKYPTVAGGMWTRFFEETIFYNTTTIDGPILFPNYFLPPMLRRKSAASFCFIHDCQHRVFPQFFSQKKRAWLDLNFRRSLDGTARVFLISEFEKRQIARFFGEHRARNCTVVYNSVDWNRYTREEPSEEIQELSSRPFVLSVSHQYVHKKTGTIIDAFSRLAANHPDMHLILVGRESKIARDRINAIADDSVRQRIVLTGFIKDADLGHLYKRCRIFVLASEYEGFGMPAVEAMGFGVPVIVTNGSSLPEVTMGNAVYVEPGSSSGVWADIISRCLSDGRDEDSLRRAAETVRAKFQPKVIAASVLSEISAFS
jgi:glycosyltransferase involved in cell wall biosynthesis